MNESPQMSEWIAISKFCSSFYFPKLVKVIYYSVADIEGIKNTSKAIFALAGNVFLSGYGGDYCK